MKKILEHRLILRSDVRTKNDRIAIFSVDLGLIINPFFFELFYFLRGMNEPMD